MGLRPYQQAGAEAFWNAANNVLLVAPTGAGKTRMCVEGVIAPAVARGQRVVFTSHVAEVITQTRDVLSSHNIAHHHDSFDVPVVCNTIQALTRRELQSPNIIVLDEAHRSRASQYQQLVRRFPAARLLGLTATPIRLDGKPLTKPDGHFDRLVVCTHPDTLVGKGVLVFHDIYTQSLERALRVDRKTGDFDMSDAGRQMTKDARLTGDAVEHMRRHALGKRTITFACTRSHAAHVVQSYREASIRAELLHGGTGKRERRRLLDALRRHAIDCIVNVGVLCEGYDEPLVECIQVLRPTLSLALWIQMTGRGSRAITSEYRRRCEGEGIPVPRKASFVLLDHAGNVERHGQPLARRDWAAEMGIRPAADTRGAADGRPMSSVPTWGCVTCSSINAGDLNLCQKCGTPRSLLPRVLGLALERVMA